MRPRQQIDAVGTDTFHRGLADTVREAGNQLVCMTTINVAILRTVQFDLFLILNHICHMMPYLIASMEACTRTCDTTYQLIIFQMFIFQVFIHVCTH